MNAVKYQQIALFSQLSNLEILIEGQNYIFQQNEQVTEPNQ